MSQQTRPRKSQNRVSLPGKSNTIVILVTTVVLMMGISIITNASINLMSLNDEVTSTTFLMNQPTPHPQLVQPDDSYAGIGKSLNLTHRANRTVDDEAFTFSNGSNADFIFDLEEKGWDGDALHANINSLHDIRNWVNGTFNYGDDGGNDWLNPTKSNDQSSVTGGEWQFYTLNQPAESNAMAGNYYDPASSPGTNGALELLINGSYVATDRQRYNTGDECGWVQEFSINRGRFQEAELQFDVFPGHVVEYPAFELRFEINHILIFTENTFSMRQHNEGIYGDDDYEHWIHYTVPQALWINDSVVFNPSVDLDSTTYTISFNQTYAGDSATFGGFDGRQYQQLLISNVSLNITSEVKPEQVGLKMNDLPIISGQYGQGELLQFDSWTQNNVTANFTSVNNASYDLEFLVDLNCSINTTGPTTTYGLDLASLGSNFLTINDTDVEWEYYAYFDVPTAFIENNLTLYYPTDWSIYWLSNPQLPADNQYGKCSIPTPGQLYVPVDEITTSPKNFWKFLATSPNYLLNVTTFRNTTITETPPGFDEWAWNTTFFAGDWVNITAQVTSLEAFTDFGVTSAWVDIKFPNGTIWKSLPSLMTVQGDYANFSAIQIPESGPDYVEGEYDIFVTWNNSIPGIPAVNETALFSMPITIKHYTYLTADQPYVEKFLEGTTHQMKVRYRDIVTNAPVNESTITFVNLKDNLQMMNPIAAGYYGAYLEHEPAKQYNQTIIVSASHPYFGNASTSIEIEVVLKTNLQADEYPSLSVPWNNNFTIHLNYTEYTSQNEIPDKEIDVTWGSEWMVYDQLDDTYTIVANASTANVNELYPLTISVDDNGYQAKTLTIDIKVEPKATYMDLFLNEVNKTTDPTVEVVFEGQINISFALRDAGTGTVVSGSTPTLGLAASTYSYSLVGEYHQFLVDTGKVGAGIQVVSLAGEKAKYQKNTTSLTLKILTRAAYLTVKLNDTVTSSLSLTIKTPLKITAAYHDDVTKALVLGATLQISGISSDTYTYSVAAGTHQWTLDTGTIGLGVHFITITATNATHDQVSTQCKVTVTQIVSPITLPTEQQTPQVLPGEDYVLQVTVQDRDPDVPVNVTYKWRFGSGQLEDPDGDGTYTATLSDIPEGSHVVYITVDRGADYEIQQFQITVSAIPEPVEGLPDWVIYLFVAIAVIIVASIIAYQTHFKYPKTIRTVRATRKGVRKEKLPDVSTGTRSSLFMDKFVDNNRKLLPSSQVTTFKEKYALSSQKKVKPEKTAVSGKKEKPSTYQELESPAPTTEMKGDKLPEKPPSTPTAPEPSKSAEIPKPPTPSQPTPRSTPKFEAPTKREFEKTPKVKAFEGKPTVKALPTKPPKKQMDQADQKDQES